MFIDTEATFFLLSATSEMLSISLVAVMLMKQLRCHKHLAALRR
jgi:hypothetical protein